jgi:hypothetical protein
MSGNDEKTLPHFDHRDIPWTLAPIPRIESFDAARLFGLSPLQVLSYACICREDLRSVRALLGEALVMIARQQDQLARSTRVIEFQRQQIRSQRVQDAA